MTGEFDDKPLSGDDIERLGREAGLAILAMSEFPSAEERASLKETLGYRAIELAYTQPTMPEGVEAE